MLHHTPQYLVRNSEFFEKDGIVSGDVDSVILPIDAYGRDGALAFARRHRNKVTYFDGNTRVSLN